MHGLSDGLVAPAPAYGPLELGLSQALHVREERLNTGPNPSRLLYISDIHLRRSRSELLCQQILDAVTRCVPHAILLGGDLADQPSELDRLSDLVRQMNNTAPVLAVAGNHDRKVGIDHVCKAVTQGGGHWIHDRVALVTHRGRVIAVSGPESGGRNSAALVDGHVRVLCAHNPRIWKRARHAGFDLVLAGHLHGCQMVAFEYRDRLFPGAFLYPYCYSSHRAGPTRLIVSRGVSDLVPIRWRCPREVVLCCV